MMFILCFFYSVNLGDDYLMKVLFFLSSGDISHLVFSPYALRIIILHFFFIPSLHHGFPRESSLSFLLLCTIYVLAEMKSHNQWAQKNQLRNASFIATLHVISLLIQLFMCHGSPEQFLSIFLGTVSPCNT